MFFEKKTHKSFFKISKYYAFCVKILLSDNEVTLCLITAKRSGNIERENS